MIKHLKTLEVRKGDQVIRSYPVGIGRDEMGPKLRRGDMKTPEGTYSICVKNPKSQFLLSLGLNYPNEQDASRGLAAGVLSETQYESILARHKLDGGSDWSTPMGGEIYIHGDLDSKPWSEGCIRMYDRDIRELYELAPVGTPVVIKP